MLCMNSYPQKYIDDCHEKMNLQLSAYEKLAVDIDPEFETSYYINMVLLLNGNIMPSDKTIKYDTEKSILTFQSPSRKQ